MSPIPWRRFLPERNQLWIPALVLVFVFAGANFMNLAATKSDARREEAAAQARVDQLRDQNERLLAERAHGERGSNIDRLARDFFHYAYPGESRFVEEEIVEPAPVPNAEAGSSGPPFWRDWWHFVTGFDK